jgi:superkiller protein 3
MNDWFEAERRVEKAHELFESGRWEDALSELTEAIRVNPYQGEWHFNMGLTLDAMGRHAEAVECYKLAIEHHGEDVEILNNLGVDHLRLGQPAEALKVLSRVEQIDPSNAACYCHRIAAHAQLGDHEQAETLFYQACHLDDRNPHAYFNIAASLLERGQADRAIWCLRHVRQLDPDITDVYPRLAEAYWMKGNHDKARRFYSKHLRIHPEDTAALLDMGRLLMLMDRPVEAAERFRQVVQLDSDNAAAHFELAQLALRADHLDQAQAGFEMALQLKGEASLAHQKLAVISLRRKDAHAAFGHLRAALAAGPRYDLRPAAEELGRLLLDAGMPHDATTVFRRLTDRHPADSALWHQLSVALFLDHRFPAGIRAARKAVRHDGKFLLAMYNLSVAHLQLNQFRRSRYWLRRALAVDPRDRRLHALRRRIRVIRLRRWISRFWR